MGGRIDNVVLDQDIDILKDKKYVFYLQEENGVFVNALDDNAVTLIEGNEIVENNVQGELINSFETLNELEENFLGNQ